MPEFIRPPRIPDDLAAQVANLIAKTPDKKTATIQAIRPGIQQALGSLGDAFERQRVRKEEFEKEKRTQQFEREKQEKLLNVDIDDIFRQAAQTLGYTVPKEMTKVGRDVYEKVIQGSTQLKVAQTRAQGWLDKIRLAQQAKDKDQLLNYRKQIVEDFTLSPEQQRELISRMDKILESKELIPEEKKHGIERDKVKQPGLPGLKVK